MLQLTREQFERIIEQGRAGKPLEVCGLLAGVISPSADNVDNNDASSAATDNDATLTGDTPGGNVVTGEAPSGEAEDDDAPTLEAHTPESGTPITRVMDVYPIDSEDRSEITYTMNPLQQLRAEKEISALGLQVVGIYHTHPATQPYPSATDVARAHWGDTDDLLFPEYSYLIVSLRDPQNPEARSFKIRGRRIPQDITEETVVVH
jgi:proteasome lid subunit RPN8/RPN11